MNALYVVLVGTLERGLICRSVLTSRDANTLVGELLVDGSVADTLKLETVTGPGLPASSPDGAYVVLVGHIVSGLEAHGPFSRNDVAHTYGKNLPSAIVGDDSFRVVTVEDAVH